MVEIDGAYLVVETTFAIQVFEELHVSFTSPEVKVTDLEVAPDYEQRCVSYTLGDTVPVNSVQWQRLYVFPLSSETNCIALPGSTRSGFS